MKITKSKHQQQKNQTTQSENNLGLKRDCQGNLFEGKKQKFRKERDKLKEDRAK